MAKITLNNVTVSDAYLALLADRGIEYWFANAGTDFAPVVESLAKAQLLETRVPTAITCPHENTAMHMAIGYFLVTGKPQAVMVHVNVGTANGMNGLLNAARGQMLVNNLAAILPHYPKGEIRHWTGLRPLTPSGRPLVGRTRLANLLVNTGHGPLGWTLAAGSARLIACLVDNKASPLDPAPFDPERRQ